MYILLAVSRATSDKVDVVDVRMSGEQQDSWAAIREPWTSTVPERSSERSWSDYEQVPRAAGKPYESKPSREQSAPAICQSKWGTVEMFISLLCLTMFTFSSLAFGIIWKSI